MTSLLRFAVPVTTGTGILNSLMTTPLLYVINSFRFVLSVDSDSDSATYDGYYSSSYESYHSDDCKGSSADEEDIISSPARTKTFRDMDESDEEIQEDSFLEPAEDINKPGINFTEKRRSTRELVANFNNKKQVPCNEFYFNQEQEHSINIFTVRAGLAAYIPFWNSIIKIGSVYEAFIK